MRFENKKVLITGSSRGIGKAIALAMAGEGAKVAIHGKNRQRKVQQVLDEIESKPGWLHKAQGFLFDVSDRDSVKEGVKKVCDSLGGLDILIHSAGIVQDSFFQNMDEDKWSGVIDSDLNGSYFLFKEVLPEMVKAGAGNILAIASYAALRGSPGQANYAAAKAGLVSLVKTLSMEYAHKNIRINAIAPGLIASGMTSRLDQDIVDQKKQMIPLGRLGQENEIVSPSLFLISEESSYITGQCLCVDGGLSA